MANTFSQGNLFVDDYTSQPEDILYNLAVLDNELKKNKGDYKKVLGLDPKKPLDPFTLNKRIDDIIFSKEKIYPGLVDTQTQALAALQQASTPSISEGIGQKLSEIFGAKKTPEERLLQQIRQGSEDPLLNAISDELAVTAGRNLAAPTKAVVQSVLHPEDVGLNYLKSIGGTIAEIPMSLRELTGMKRIDELLMPESVKKTLDEGEKIIRQGTQTAKEKLIEQGLPTSLIEAPDLPYTGKDDLYNTVAATVNTAGQLAEGLTDYSNLPIIAGLGLAGPAAGAIGGGLAFGPPALKHTYEKAKDIYDKAGSAVTDVLTGKSSYSKPEMAADITEMVGNLALLGLIGKGGIEGIRSIKPGTPTELMLMNDFIKRKSPDILAERAAESYPGIEPFNAFEGIREGAQGYVPSTDLANRLYYQELFESGGKGKPITVEPRFSDEVFQFGEKPLVSIEQERLIRDEARDLFPFLAEDPLKDIGFKSTVGEVLGKEPVDYKGSYSAKSEPQVQDYVPSMRLGGKQGGLTTATKEFIESLFKKVKDEGGWIKVGKDKKVTTPEYEAPSAEDIGARYGYDYGKYETYFSEPSPELLQKVGIAAPAITAQTKIADLPKTPEAGLWEQAYKSFADMKGVEKTKAEEIANKARLDAHKKALNTLPETERADALRDVGKFTSHFMTVDRMIDDVTRTADPLMGDVLRKKLVDQTLDADIARIQELKSVLDATKETDKNFKRGSRERESIIDYAEGKLTKDQLQAIFGDEKAATIVAEANKYKTMFEQLRTSTNRVLEANGKDPIPYLENYFTHAFEYASTWERLLTGDTSSASGMVGQNKFVKRNIRNIFSKQRTGAEGYIKDPVQAMDAYARVILKQKHFTPVVETYRGVVKALTDIEQKSGVKLTQFKARIDDIAEAIVSKNGMNIDATMKRVVPNWIIKSYKALNNRLGANAVVGNLQTALMQVANAPQIMADAGPLNYVKGMTHQFFEAITGKESFAFKNSPFMKRRYADIEKVVKTKLDKAKDVANFITHQFERFNTESAWRANYESYRSKGLGHNDAVKKADADTIRQVADRGIGQKPVAFESETMAGLVQFQLEANNALFRYRDYLKGGNYGKALKMAAYSYAFNELIGMVTGRKPLFDPAGAVVDVSRKDDDRDMLQKAGRIGGEFLKAIPLGAIFAQLAPEDVRKKYFGGTDIGTFTSATPIGGLIDTIFRSKDNKDRLFKLATKAGLPFGGSQVSKTYRGYEDLAKKELRGEPVTTTTKIKELILGPYSVKDTDMLDELYRTREESKEQTKANFDKAEKLYEKYLSMKSGKIAFDQGFIDDLNKIQKTDKNLAWALGLVKDRYDRGLNEIEGKMEMLNEYDGSRAGYIIKYANKLYKTDEDRKAYYNNLIKKGVITKPVMKDMKRILEQKENAQ